jgi:hypothetical protein
MLSRSTDLTKTEERDVVGHLAVVHGVHVALVRNTGALGCQFSSSRQLVKTYSVLL